MRDVSLALLLALGSLTPAAATTHRLMVGGQALNRPTGDQRLSLDVRERGVVMLSVDRPGFDDAEYRARLPAGGNEQYRPCAVTTTYRLTDAAGRVLLRHIAAEQVTPQVLFSAELQPGRYRLTLTVGESAKRRVGLSVAGPVEVSANSINNTVQGRQWVPVNVFHAERPLTLRLYSGDSAEELGVPVRSRDGRTLLLPSGAQGQWTQVPFPVRSGVIEARQGAGARQWSKSFSLILQDGWGHVLPQVLQAWAPASRAHTVVIQPVPVPVQVVEVQEVRAVAREVVIRDVTFIRSQETGTVQQAAARPLPPPKLAGPDDSTFIGPVSWGPPLPARSTTVRETVQQGQDVSFTGRGLLVKLALVSKFLPKSVASGSIPQELSSLRFDLWPGQGHERHLSSSLAAPTAAQTTGLGSELMHR